MRAVHYSYRAAGARSSVCRCLLIVSVCFPQRASSKTRDELNQDGGGWGGGGGATGGGEETGGGGGDTRRGEDNWDGGKTTGSWGRQLGDGDNWGMGKTTGGWGRPRSIALLSRLLNGRVEKCMLSRRACTLGLSTPCLRVLSSVLARVLSFSAGPLCSRPTLVSTFCALIQVFCPRLSFHNVSLSRFPAMRV